MESINEELELFKGIIKGIALQFGENCEVVLHDLTQSYESTIVAIENGQVTGRRVGDPGTNLGLEILQGTVAEYDKYNYVTQTKDGRILRSTSIYIKNAVGKPVGAICMNYDISDLMMAEKTIKNLTASALQSGVKETFVTNVNELLDVLIQETQDQIGKPVVLMSKENKIEFIRLLHQKGAFLIKKAGEKICGYLNISKFTLYGYLEESKLVEESELSIRKDGNHD